MPTKTETLVLVIDPAVPLEIQVLRGNYKHVNHAINAKNFNLTLPTGKREIILYDPRGTVSSGEMFARMKADKCVPATLDDALAMGVQHPDRQRKNPIVFLGTVRRVSDGDRLVPVLNCWLGRRKLSLYWFDRGWYDNCRFAAVRESK